MNMKKILSIAVLCAVAVSAMAVPARPGWQTRTQADGTAIEVQLCGDEFYHYTVNRDGKQVQLNTETGMYEVIGDAPTGDIVKARRARLPRANARRARQEFGKTPNLAPRGIVILVNFTDKAFQAAHTRTVFDSLCNAVDCKVNKDGTKYYPSAGQYFLSQSNGLYHPVFDVYGPVTLSRNMKYYGENDSQDNDKRPAVAVVEACKLLENSVDFTLYDSDEDGKIDFVYMIYAGEAESSTEVANQIWPHAFSIDEEFEYQDTNFTSVYPNIDSCKVDGKQVNTYACSSELSGSSIDGIGTLCHEFSHVMGLPDFYDTEYGTNYNSKLTPNEWDVMDGGAYNGNGHCPPNYSAWEKYFFGWVEPKNLGDQGASLTLYPNGSEEYNVYQINEAGELQSATTDGLNYYIEFRKKTGWDTNLPATGMLIWKVDYDENLWVQNTPNNGGRRDTAPHYTLVIPSGTKIGVSYGAKNVWPYSVNKIVYNSWKGVTGKPLTDITNHRDSITLVYIEEGEEPVDPQGVEDIHGDKVQATKVIRNGQVLIIRNGVIYDLNGRVL